ncbi:MAG: hypothetical protein IH991_06250 [Planctomycetes bacterium]|nr:hypothetical protein [Planctomycetota bacterium]
MKGIERTVPKRGRVERWLRVNARLLLTGLIVPALALLAGLLLAVLAFSPWSWVGVALIALSTFLAIGILVQLRLPRIGYHDGYLLLYLRTIEPARVPIDVVECFFLGQTTSMIKAPSGDELKTSAVVVRLAEAAKECHNREVKAELGQWCDGYITIRGTWCEPLNSDVLKRMNHRLAEIHKARRAIKTEST